MTAVMGSSVILGVWTILDDSSETVQATVTREREVYAVRDARGRILGRYPTVRQALASIAA
jgi:hypothetical protein